MKGDQSGRNRRKEMLMAFSRRRLFQYLALTGGCNTASEAAEPAIGLDMLRIVAVAHGTKMSDERLRVIKPVVEQRFSELRAIRDFEIDDRVAPTVEILRK
jgi:hypothetical protein